MDETKKFAITDSGKKIRIRKIYKRNLFLGILSCIFSFGVYGYFWQYELDKETKSITKYKFGPAPSLVIFLSIITCGIYTYFWAYGLGKNIGNFYLMLA